MTDEIKKQINDIIEGEIQNGINEYIEKEGKGFKGQELRVNVNEDELNKLVKKYNLGQFVVLDQAKVLGILDVKDIV